MAKKQKMSASPAEMRRNSDLKRQRPAMAELISRADYPPGKSLKSQASPPAMPRVESEAERLLHELKLQNAELQGTRNKLELVLERYTDLYDFAPVGYFTLRPDGGILMANLTGARLFGIERTLLVGRSFGLLVKSEFRSLFRTFLLNVFGGIGTQSSDFELVCKGQSCRAVTIEAECMPNGRECRVMVWDVTAHKTAQDQVRVSEIRYRRLFEAAHDGVLLLDPATRKITDANPFISKLLGYAHEQLVGKELFEIGLLKDEGSSRKMFRELRKTHQVRYEDLPLVTETGKHQEVEVVANLYDENGRDIIQCNIRDISARKHAADVLRRSESLFTSLIGQAPVGVYLVDARFCLQETNPLAMRVFAKIHPLIGRDFSEIIHLLWPKRVAKAIEAQFRRTLKTGEAYQSREFSETRRDTGESEVYEWQVQRVTLPNGEYAVVCFFSDITQRKRAELAQRSLAVLEASNVKLKEEILYRKSLEAALHKSEQRQKMLLQKSQKMQSQLRNFSHKILHAQEEERKRISRQLHDEIVQTLVGINVHLAAFTVEAASNPKCLEQKIVRTKQLVAKSVEVVHRFARELRPTVLDDLGLTPALHTFMKEFSKRTGINTRLTTFAAIENLDASRRTVLFRVAQEAMTNVYRHANATLVVVTIQENADGVCMEITDDGKSFGVAQAMQSSVGKQLGLLGMRERLEMVGGSFAVDSIPSKGTTITAQIPTSKSRVRNMASTAKAKATTP